MPNTKEKGKLIEVLSKHIPYGYATLGLIADELMADGVRLEEKRATSDVCITKAVREKLVDDVHSKLMGLLQRAPYIRCEDVHRQYAVNWLMNNGVTVQEWISVKDRLPDTIPCSAGTAYSEAVNVLTDGRKVLTAIWDGTTFLCDADYWEAWGEKITHWTPVLLPLPQPPKGE